MRIQQLLSIHFPYLHSTDKISFAIEQFSISKTNALPVLQDNVFKGLILEGDILKASRTELVASLSNFFIPLFAHPNDHFTRAIKLMTDASLDIVPVVDEKNEWLGAVTYKNLMIQIAQYLDVSQPGGIIVLQLDRLNYAFSELSHLVEASNAFITQLNTHLDQASGLLNVTIKINKIEVSEVVDTLQRHAYSVKYYFGEELYNNDLQDNYNHLMNYLNV